MIEVARPTSEHFEGLFLVAEELDIIFSNGEDAGSGTEIRPAG